MEQQAFLFDLMRIKFGFMACFHFIFVPLTPGLIVSAACMESAFVWTRDTAWRRIRGPDPRPRCNRLVRYSLTQSDTTERRGTCVAARPWSQQ
jgi:hypothetical protein